MKVAKIYWEVIPNTLAITTTEKVGFNSIRYALAHKKRRTAADLRARKVPTRLYLRHPIARLVSAWAWCTSNGGFTWKDHPRLPTLEQFIDAILAGAANEHWSPQIAQHDYFTEVYRFESIAYTWPHKHTRELGWHNKGRMKKPVVNHRLDEIERFYVADLAAWRNVRDV